MKIINAACLVIKKLALFITWALILLGGLCVLLIASSITASALDYTLNLIGVITPFFTSWTGMTVLAVIWLTAGIKWWKQYTKKIERIRQFTPEERKEYDENKLNRKKAAKTRDDKIAIIFLIGFTVYLIGKSNLLYALVGILADISTRLNYYMITLCVINLFGFYMVIQSLNQISNNLYFGITEIKEKLDTIINEMEEPISFTPSDREIDNLLRDKYS